MAEEIVDKLRKKIDKSWHAFSKKVGKIMKNIGDDIGVTFIYLGENPNNPKYFWRNKGSKAKSIYDEQWLEDTDSDPDDPDEVIDSESTECEEEDEDKFIKKKP